MEEKYVIGIPVPWDETRSKHLESTVQLPSGSSTLRMSSKIFLEHAQSNTTFTLSKMCHLVADDTRFILVVGNRTSSMHTGNTEIVNSETPGSQCSTKRCNTFVLTPEIVTPHVESGFELTLSFAFNVLGTVAQVGVGIEVWLRGFHGGDFVLEECVL